MEDEHWSQQAICRDAPDMQFPGSGDEYALAAAKKVCGRCPVRLQCLEWALDTKEPFGVLGGYSERERRRLKFRRKSA